MAGKSFMKETGFRSGLWKVTSQKQRPGESQAGDQGSGTIVDARFEGGFRNQSGFACCFIYSFLPPHGVFSQEDADAQEGEVLFFVAPRRRSAASG